jgi:hypothetical protein
MKTTKKPTPKKKIVKAAPRKAAPRKAAPRKAVPPVSMPRQVRAEAPKPRHKVIFAKCRRGSDMATIGQSCNSKRAYKLSPDGASLVQFRCVECDHVWSVPVGGTINL